MTQHNIIGTERGGAHVLVRRVKQVRRRTVGDQILSAIGGVTVLTLLIIIASKVLVG